MFVINVFKVMKEAFFDELKSLTNFIKMIIVYQTFFGTHLGHSVNEGGKFGETKSKTY
jgi:hypothetical protein